MNHPPARIDKHHLRVIAAALAASGLTILALLLHLNAVASGSPSDPNLGHKVTICHSTSSASNPFTSNTVDVVSSGLRGGHENHSGDIIPPFTYVDRHDDVIRYPGKNMTTMFDGTSGADLLANGCNPPAPADVCPNIDGNQATVPDGMTLDDEGNCVRPVEPVDVCPNIDGNQDVLPDGMTLDADGNCVTPDDPDGPTDVCPNIDGVQEALPEGMLLVDGECVEEGTEDDDTPDAPDGPGGGDTPTPDGPAGGGDRPTPDTPDGGGDTPTPDTPDEGDAEEPTEADDAGPVRTGETVTPAKLLPYTGAQENLLIALGFGLIVGGAVLEVAYRRGRAPRAK